MRLTLEQVNSLKQLRDRTSLSFKECKLVLYETKWDLEEAIKFLQRRYFETAPHILH